MYAQGTLWSLHMAGRTSVRLTMCRLCVYCCIRVCLLLPTCVFIVPSCVFVVAFVCVYCCLRVCLLLPSCVFIFAFCNESDIINTHAKC